MPEVRRPTPEPSRPRMPGYGILDAGSGTGLLSWSWAEERLANARNYWVATTRADGRPHCMPVWGIWLNGTFYFSTGPRSQKARNLARSPKCVVCPERADEAVILEGTAEEITAPTLLKRFKEVYEAKYQWDMDTSAGGIYSVRPLVAFGFRETNDFLGSATRWRFPGD